MIKYFISISFLFCLFVLPISAKDDYSNIKGDWKIIQLGDDNETVIKKLNYLQKKGAFDEYGVFDNFSEDGTYSIVVGCAKMFDDKYIGIKLSFTNDKLLYSIIFSFENVKENSYDTIIKNQLYKKIKPMFTKIYGEAIESNDFPDIDYLVDKQLYVTDVWEIKQVNKLKSISIGAFKFGDYYHAQIIILDKNLQNKLLKDKDEALDNTIKNSIDDFN